MFKRVMIGLIFTSKLASAQQTAPAVTRTDSLRNPVFTLGEVVVTADRNRPINATLGGINNIADRNYMLVEGYAEPGRNYFVNLVYHL